MFFSVSTEIDRRFPNNHQVNNLWVNCDNGWQRTDTTFYKGYDDNYCKIIVDSGGASIEHSQPRSFPLWYQEGIVTNIDSSLTPAWADDVVCMDVSGKITTAKINIDLTVPTQTLTIDQAQGQIRQLLDKKLTQVPDNLKLFCSGGLDTLLLYSMLFGRCSFELITHEHYEHDQFTKTNQSALSKFWSYSVAPFRSYTKIHHWAEPVWLATGSHGDEYFLRGPAVIAMLTAWHDINFGQLLTDNPNCYHYYHFNKYAELWPDAWDNRFQLQKDYPTIELLNQQIMNILVNDHQHWHLGNTLTWTPYKDIEITRILLQCPINELIPQFLDGQLSKDLIIDYNPAIVDYLSQYKNHNPREKLPKLIENHAKSVA